MKFRMHKTGARQTAREAWDPEEKTPAIRCSICTGEQVAGFIRKEDGKFEEGMLIRNDAELQAFRERYGITGEIRKIY